MCDLTLSAFELAARYRNPAVALREQVKLAKFLNDPTLTKPAVNAVLHLAGKLAVAEKAVCNDKTSTWPQHAVRFRQHGTLVSATPMTTALQCIGAVKAARRQNRVLIVTLDDARAFLAAGRDVKCMGVLHLPRHACEPQ
jgi:hypothetical protein